MKTRKIIKLRKQYNRKKTQYKRIKQKKTVNKQKQKNKKTRRKKGGAIPLGPVVTIGVLGLAAIVGPIIGAYLDESNIERAKREANEIMREKHERLKDDKTFSESTKEQVWDEEKRERYKSLGLTNEDEKEDDKFPPMSPEGAFTRKEMLSGSEN